MVGPEFLCPAVASIRPGPFEEREGSEEGEEFSSPQRKARVWFWWFMGVDHLGSSEKMENNQQKLRFEAYV
jgi:hypothetical protein